MIERVVPGPDQESAWDSPQPPRVEQDARPAVVWVPGRPPTKRSLGARSRPTGRHRGRGA